jgi:HSP20 family molecular chaperone IbpA
MGIEDDFAELRRALDRMLKEAWEGRTGVFKDNSSKARRMDRPADREVHGLQHLETGEILSEEPRIEIQDDRDRVYVTIEFPPGSDEELSLEVEARRVTVETNGGKVRKMWELPEDVETTTFTETYNNGVLDLILIKKVVASVA